MGVFSTWRDRYVIWHANQFDIPQFKQDEIVRYKLIFSGRVQKVGFRLEIETLANRLALTGYVQNLSNGSVLAEVQGTVSQIDYLISCMHSLKRAKVSHIEREPLEVVKEEKLFESDF